MIPGDFIQPMITGAVAAIGSSLLTVAGLRVHIEYLRKADERHDADIKDAHRRIDEINAKGCAHRAAHPD